MTFCVTCVVERIVVTHFMNPVAGYASGMNRVEVKGENSAFSILETVVDDSNQKRQVSWFTHVSQCNI